MNAGLKLKRFKLIYPSIIGRRKASQSSQLVFIFLFLYQQNFFESKKHKMSYLKNDDNSDMFYMVQMQYASSTFAQQHRLQSNFPIHKKLDFIMYNGFIVAHAIIYTCKASSGKTITSTFCLHAKIGSFQFLLLLFFLFLNYNEC